MTQLETTMSTVCDALKVSDGWREIENRGAAVDFVFRHETGQYRVVVAAYTAPHSAMILVRLPLAVPEAKRKAMAEAVVRANYGSLLGRFDLSMADGDLNFAAAIPLIDNELTESLFESVLQSALAQSVLYFRAFGRLLFDDELTPAEVIGEIELGSGG